MKFSEFFAGQVITAGPYRVSEADIIDYAQKYDPQWFHTDTERARNGHFGGLIASGWHTCAIAMKFAVATALHDSESLASPGMEQIRWPHPVRPGDELHFKATVNSLRRSRSRNNLGIMQWRLTLVNQHGVEVLSMEATSLFQLNGLLKI